MNVGDILRRIAAAPRALNGDQQLAGLAALALLVSMFLPWWGLDFGEFGSASNNGFDYFLTGWLPLLIVIAILMISVNFALSVAATKLERRLRRSSRAPRPLDPQAIEQEGAPGARVQQAD